MTDERTNHTFLTYGFKIFKALVSENLILTFLTTVFSHYFKQTYDFIQWALNDTGNWSTKEAVRNRRSDAWWENKGCNIPNGPSILWCVNKEQRCIENVLWNKKESFKSCIKLKGAALFHYWTSYQKTEAIWIT